MENIVYYKMRKDKTYNLMINRVCFYENKVLGVNVI